MSCGGFLFYFYVLGQLLSVIGQTPTFANLYQKFGLSCGEYKAVKKMYVLNYPGLALCFPLGDKVHLYKQPTDVVKYYYYFSAKLNF